MFDVLCTQKLAFELSDNKYIIMTFRANDSLPEQIAQHLTELIISGELVEGERIQELRIAGELDVSRGAVREALLLLQRRHLIDILPRRGAVVTEITVNSVKSLYELLSLHYSLVIKRLATQWQGDQLNDLLTMLEHLQAAVDDEDVERFYQRSYDLFTLAQPFASNAYLDTILSNLQPSARRAAYLALLISRRDLNQAYQYIKALLDAVVVRQDEQAVTLLEQFFLHQRNLVLDALLRVKQIEMAWARRQRR